MAKCWTCGTHVSGYHYTCSDCQSLTELKSLQKKVASHGRDISEHLDYIAQVQREGFADLSDILSTGLSEIASAIEWGFGEISWQLQQQTDVLRSIDHTLKTPSETKANEWRLQAEELRRRGVLEESEEFFLKALTEYRLDYRIYVGLAETYLQMNKFDQAKSFLEKSLPHAPKKGIDYKSYSYRLIGHIYACEEDYNQAVSILQSSIELSPTYEAGHYDYSQYCAQTGNSKACLSSLQQVILAKPLYWYLAQNERNFDPVKNEIETLLSNISSESSRRAKDAIEKAERTLNKSHEAVSEARGALIVSRDKATLKSNTMYENAEAKLKVAKAKVASGDYVKFLEAKPIAEESYAIANNALDTAKREREYYFKRRKEKVKNAWFAVPAALIVSLLSGFLGWFMIGSGGCMIRVLSGPPNYMNPTIAYTHEGKFGFLIGIVSGLIICIIDILDGFKQTTT